MRPSQLRAAVDAIDWPLLLAAFDEKRIAARDTKGENKSAHLVVWREFWAALGNCLKAAELTIRFNGHSQPEAMRPLPPGAWHPLRLMEEYTSELALGHIPLAIENVVRREGGRTAATRSENYPMRMAVIYIKAAQLGIVEDRAPIKTIVKHFQVARRTVQNWAAEIDVDLDQCDHSKIEQNMVQASSNYCKSGRSLEAILARDNRAQGCN
jgi:hypothetical protein